MIPSVIAYADLAGLPLAHGLYAALAGMLGYAIFASSTAGHRRAGRSHHASRRERGRTARGRRSGAIAVLSAATALIGGTIMLIAARLRLR